MSATVVPSDLVGAGSRPTDPTQVWDLTSLLLTDWDRDVELESTWWADVTEALTASEKRLALGGKPDRVLKVTMPAYTQRESWQLLNRVKRMGLCRSLMPLYCDSLAVWSRSGAVLNGDCRDRRFYAGGRVVLGRRARTGAGIGPECDVFETGLVGSKTDWSLTLQSSPSFTPEMAWPCLEVDVGVQPDLHLTTDWHSAVSFVAKEVTGPSALPPWPDRSRPTFLGYPVFDVDYPQQPDQLTVGWHRDVKTQRYGGQDVFLFYGTRPRAVRNYTFQPYTRAAACDVLSFFDQQRGQLKPFVGVSPLHHMEVLSIDTDVVTVVASGPVSDWQDYGMLAVRAKGGSTEVARISGVSRSGSVDTINLTDAVTPQSLAANRWVTTAHLMRFTDPNVNEKWATTEHCTTTLNAIELLEEKNVSINDG